MIWFSGMTEEERDKYIYTDDDYDGPMVVYCYEEGCDELDVVMDFDTEERCYICPNCGKRIDEEDALSYMEEHVR